MRVRWLASVALALALLGSASPAVMAAPGMSVSAAVSYRNCTALNKVYPHGVGKPGARDRVSGSSKPVTTFKRSLALYNANKSRDRDGDGVACEKR